MGVVASQITAYINRATHVEGERKSVRDRASMVRAVVKISTCYQVTRGVTALLFGSSSGNTNQWCATLFP